MRNRTITNPDQNKISTADRQILRDLGRRILEIAADPVNLERKRLWYLLDEGRSERPMVLCEPAVAWESAPDSRNLKCQNERARGLERGLRYHLWVFEKIRDDYVIEPRITCNWRVQTGNFGVEVKTEWATKADLGNVASRHWDPPIKDFDRDFDKLRPRTFSVDRDATFAEKARLEEIFGGILPVEIRGGFFWSLGMTGTAIELVGLENLMLSMYTQPKGLHRLMAFLRDDHMAFIDWLEKENLFCLNNENDYTGSGSIGYTHALPQPDRKPGDPVRPRDLWVLSESQETVGVGPQQFEEFVFQYQQPLIERFGRSYYGCCEPLHTRWHVVKKLSNLKRISVSPWCDEAFMAEALGRDYVYSRKPKPTLISTERFDEDAIRADLRNTLTVARGCNVELIMKDVHTLSGQPHRMARWVELAREAIDETA